MKLSKENLWTALLVALVLIIGALGTWWTVERADGEMRKDLLREARALGQTLNVNRIKGLSGTEADLTAPDYLRLKDQLSRGSQTCEKCRFHYVMGRKADGTIFFFADSEPAESKAYSPAGQIYEEAPDCTRRAFETGVEAVEGPVIDRWGTWVSTFVPLIDPATGNVVAVLGMDVDTRTWGWDVARTAFLPGFLTLALAAILLICSGRLARRSC